MTIEAPEVGRPTEEYDAWLDRRWRLPCRMLVLFWGVILLTAGLGAEKESSFHHLEAGLRDGSVSEVEITNLPGPDSTGLSLVTLRWEGRFLDRYAEVAVGKGTRGGSMQPWARDLPYVQGDLVQRLRDLDPGLHLTYVDHHSGSHWEVMSWRVPKWLGVASLAAWLTTLGLAIGGPEPWRATRAAWFWLILLGSGVGVTAFLVLGGPLGLGRPRDRSRRLTGGWAFLLAVLLLGGLGA